MLAPIVRPYRWRLALAVTLNALHGIGITCQNLTVTWLLGWVITPQIEDAERWRRLGLLALFYCVMSLVGRMLVWHLGYRIFTWCRERMVLALRALFFRHVNHLCLRFHLRHSSGELFSFLFGSPLAQVMQFYNHCSIHVPGAVMVLLSMAAVTLSWDPVLTVVMLVAVVMDVALMFRSIRKQRAIHSAYQQAESEVSGGVADLLRGTRAVKLYAMEDRIARDFERQAERIGVMGYRRDIESHVMWMQRETFHYVGFMLMMVGCVWRYLDGAIRPEQVVGYMMGFIQLHDPLTALFGASSLWGSARASLERIGTVLREASTTPDPQGTEHELPERGDIELEDVHFGYGSEPVLRGLSLRIPYGQKIAFVGPSGAGKSTISQLLLRLYDPDRGSVSLGGVDLRRCGGNEIRRRFGVVPQDPFVFRTDIRDNIKVARPDADDAAIRGACELANAWEFIAKLPQGLETKVGEGGSTLSGGQRQRLAIARALLADPPFYVFDEATSALDTLSERLIQESLERNLGGRTAIFIAHRLATVKHCDRIVVIDGGRVVQDGTYDELVASDGMFRELVRGQLLRE